MLLPNKVQEIQYVSSTSCRFLKMDDVNQDERDALVLAKLGKKSVLRVGHQQSKEGIGSHQNRGASTSYQSWDSPVPYW